ncbi:Uncharacterised protein [Zhongshania aliphaticivorans]|jgi:hypothetical protein|uniref:Pentapeptide MXKDX repeat protein n=2 Tax=Zhongshania TaxID=1434050 RepID=A0A5S9NGI0_9GAMM|nr:MULTISPECIES: hypothetical protein [Zhongshania]MBW2941445.1 hypothetical protein [Zhongshania aquimaris]CAA0089003.1 Uncharacterised protein [Zhongshania aliphaticivorans]CAA0095546.1 Uncharacterised protein [Zhongshania aliphaticivorans]
MRSKFITMSIAISTLAFTLSAQAHDPKEHMNNAEKPDCAAMENMDHSKMDMNDPVMQAMMKQCMGDMEGMEGMSGSEAPQGAKPAQHGNESSTEQTGHNH